MKNILFLIDRKNCQLALPLLIWRRVLAKSGLCVRVSCRSADIAAEQWDTVILTEPLYRWRYKANHQFSAEGIHPIRKDIKAARRAGARVVFFDARDGTDSRWFRLLPEVDQFWKKQLLFDRDYYCSRTYRQKPSIWVTTEQAPREPADAKYVDKLKVGWNLAYHPYGWLRRGDWIPLWYGLVSYPRCADPAAARPLLTTFRGRLGGDRKDHRQATIDALDGMDHPRILTGGLVSRRQFSSELKSSQVVVSPFGYGEPCFRDMEAFIAGAVLLKPSLRHMETFPDIYKPEKTYVEYSWDSSDLPEILLELEAQPERMRQISLLGQKMFKRVWANPDTFVSHFAGLLS